jgi:hypothetical protein
VRRAAPEPTRPSSGAAPVPRAYDVLMPDDDSSPGDYPPAVRLAALLGLAVTLALAFILVDVATGGKLTGTGCGCDDHAEGAPGA